MMMRSAIFRSIFYRTLLAVMLVTFLFKVPAEQSIGSTPKYPLINMNVGVGDARPYIFVEGGTVSQDKPGYSIQFVEEIAANINWQLSYRVLPFKRQLAELSAGSIDMIIGKFKTPASDFLYSKTPVGIAELCIFKLQNNSFELSNNFDNLREQKLGGALGYSYGKLDAYISAPQNAAKVLLIPGQDEVIIKQLVTLLSRGRIDVFVETKDVVMYYLANNAIDNVVSAGCFDTLYAFLAVSNKLQAAKQHLDTFDLAAVNYQHSDAYKKLLNTYKLDDWLRSYNFNQMKVDATQISHTPREPQ